MDIDGKYYFNFRIQEYTDFLKPTDIITFVMKEFCGATGVLFEMVFQTESASIANLIVENNEVIFEFGTSADKAISYKAYITEHSCKNTSDDKISVIRFVATSISMEFYTSRDSENIKGTSLDVIKHLAKKYLGTTVDVQIDTPTEAEVNWVRSFETGAVSMVEAWTHMNLPKSVPLLWIDSSKKVHLTDLERIKKGGVKQRFVPEKMKGKEKERTDDIGYLNEFNPNSFKFDTNLIKGKNTIVNISGIESGNDTVFIPETKPEIASTATTESGEIANKVIDNIYQTDNVHAKFMQCYYENKQRLIGLSSVEGQLVVLGNLPNVQVCDLVEVVGCRPRNEGRYLVNTKVVGFAGSSPVKTTLILCRDNQNSIEDVAITPKNDVKITNQQMTDILQSVRTLRRVTIMGTKLLDGTTKNNLMGYCKTFKYRVLSGFQIMGVPFNLNSSLELMQSLKNIGMSILNNIIDKFIPYPYNMLLKEAILNGFNFKALLMKFLAKYVPDFLRDLLSEIMLLLAALVRLADALHKQNSKKLSDYEYVSGGYSTNDDNGGDGNASGVPSNKDEDIPNKDEDNDVPKDTDKDNTENIGQITDEILDNVDGIDIPIPDIKLDESESLLPRDELEEVIVDKVIAYLEGQGYLDGISSNTFKLILTGKRPLDFNTIKLINGNIGNVLYARYWGTFSGEITKLGRIIDIQDKSIVTPKVDITDDVFVGDSIIVAGTENSNGTYTVTNVEYDKYNNVSIVDVLEDIVPYHDVPIKTYTNICAISNIETHQKATIIDSNREQKTLEDITIINVIGKYTGIFVKGLAINVSNLGSDGHCLVKECDYDKERGLTRIFTTTVLKDVLNKEKKVQIVVETENGTALSKLSNHLFTADYIKNGFKDIYNTVPCTKIVNALKGTKVWICLPDIVALDTIEFYINSKKVEMDVIGGIDLNMYAPGGAKLYYNAFMSKETYNSNSVTLEVRRKL